MDLFCYSFEGKYQWRTQRERGISPNQKRKGKRDKKEGENGKGEKKEKGENKEEKRKRKQQKPVKIQEKILKFMHFTLIFSKNFKQEI